MGLASLSPAVFRFRNRTLILVASPLISFFSITRLASRKTLGIFAVEGLEAWAQSPRPRGLFIELTQFSRTWRQGALGASLREHAPHLFQEPAPSRDFA